MNRPFVGGLGLILCLVALPSVAGDKTERRAAKRAAIDSMARQAVTRLLAENDRASDLADSAVAYAVFDSFKLALFVSGGGGVGIAVDNRTGEATFWRFVERGWQADASANAVAGTNGKNADASFTHGLAVFQLTHKALMAQADVSGTKYWKHKKLNR